MLFDRGLNKKKKKKNREAVYSQVLLHREKTRQK